MTKVIVLGSTGYIGKATVLALAAKKVHVTAGIRDTTKPAAQELTKAGANVLKLDMSEQAEQLSTQLKGFDSAYIVSPGHIDRTKITLNAVKAAKLAGIKYILVVSVPLVGTPALFGKQFTEIEAGVKASGIHYGLLRLPMFIDNNWGNAGTIASSGAFYGPVAGNVEYVTVAIKDAADVAVEILQNTAKHQNVTYTLTSSKQSNDELAQIFTQVLKKEVKYVTAGYPAAQQALVGLGLPLWQADGVLEIFQLAEKKDATQTTLSNDIQKVLNRNATSALAWVQSVAQGFGGQ